MLHCSLPVCGLWTTVVHSSVRYELTHTSRLNNTDRVRDMSYVAANVLRFGGVISKSRTSCFYVLKCMLWL